MSEKSLERIDLLLRKAIAYYAAGRLPQYFFALENAKLQSMFKFNEDERKKLKAIEIRYSNEKRLNYKWAFAKKYQEVLMDLMDRYGLLLPNKLEGYDDAY